MANFMEYCVGSVRWKGHLKEIRLIPNNFTLNVPLSACLSSGDRIRIKDSNAWVLCKNGKAKFLEPYSSRERLKVGTQPFDIIIKEITEIDEYKAYLHLAEFHYRGHIIHGRTAKLIMRAFHPVYPKVLGYIELATPFFMNKARANILNSTFNANSIKWKKWDKATLRKYIHLFVRIARTVVLPEFRGLGIGKTLVVHAAKFARERWQVSGYLPYFLEISADMLKYVRFAEHAGMLYVGDTEGNLNRVANDMNYLISRFGFNKDGQAEFEEKSGICDKQISRMTWALKVMDNSGLSKKELIGRLEHLSREGVLKDFALFHRIVTLPKPHYMLGLHRKASKFLKKRIAEMNIKNERNHTSIYIPRLTKPIALENIEISYTSHVRRTKSTHAIQLAFGISPDELHTTVIKGLSLEFHPGEIVLIVGPSGSGKTSLMNLLDGSLLKREGVCFCGTLDIPREARMGFFEPIKSKKPIIEIFGLKDISHGLHLLNIAGLSEAFIYLKRYSELSAGQKYRAMLAKLISSGKNVWLGDEFCTNLDHVTANIVSFNLQKIARRVGATVILASPHVSSFLFSLNPDKVIVLSSAHDQKVLSGGEYCKIMDEFRDKNGKVPSLSLYSEFFDSVKKGMKTSTIRKGRSTIKPGALLLKCGSNKEILVNVTCVEHKKLSQITNEDAVKDGFKSLKEFKDLMSQIYPRISEDVAVTIVNFKPFWSFG